MSSETEVLSFDIDEYNYRECQVHNHGFYLGEQSKQDEIDELQKRIDSAVEHIEDYYGVVEFGMIVDILKGDQV